jgi:hypothetical protein
MAGSRRPRTRSWRRLWPETRKGGALVPLKHGGRDRREVRANQGAQREKAARLRGAANAMWWPQADAQPINDRLEREYFAPARTRYGDSAPPFLGGLDRSSRCRPKKSARYSTPSSGFPPAATTSATSVAAVFVSSSSDSDRAGLRLPAPRRFGHSAQSTLTLATWRRPQRASRDPRPSAMETVLVVLRRGRSEVVLGNGRTSRAVSLARFVGH